MPDRLTGPEPVCWKIPPIAVVAPEVLVNVPLLLMVTGPDVVVIMEPLTAMLLPVKEIPPAALVFKLPLTVVVPVPAV